MNQRRIVREEEIGKRRDKRNNGKEERRGRRMIGRKGEEKEDWEE